ncbi:hypothetical protein ADCFC_01130 [Adlercreutzia hattorii]|uniref:Uncharacterized protein n=1 Tax=Adlercreutzia hattorii TaxID=2707299 RepID=A0A6F8SIN5_9ACTN|nr:hypothetical protein ADCFC_02330 [Adlercreutzia hattorii]
MHDTAAAESRMPIRATSRAPVVHDPHAKTDVDTKTAMPPNPTTKTTGFSGAEERRATPTLPIRPKATDGIHTFATLSFGRRLSRPRTTKQIASIVE